MIFKLLIVAAILRRATSSFSHVTLYTEIYHEAPRRIQVVNKCTEDIWIATSVSAYSKSKAFPVVKLNSKISHEYIIPNKEGWSGWLWPKMDCDENGQFCNTGQSIPPCPAVGCQPSADTQVEFSFSSSEASVNTFYTISLINGYSLPVTVKPSKQDETCKAASCQVFLADCPKNELFLGNLRSNTTARNCLSPCSKWKQPAPFGQGKDEKSGVGLHYCCPTPLQPDLCRKAIEESKYLALLQEVCPLAYSFSYDQHQLQSCHTDTTLIVTFCG